MNIQAGMTVRLKNKKGEGWNTQGDMDMYKGAIVYVEKVGATYMFLRRIPEDKQKNYMVI